MFTWLGVNPSCSERDRKSTRLNSSHLGISYAVFCLKKKKRGTIRFRARRRTIPAAPGGACRHDDGDGAGGPVIFRRQLIPHAAFNFPFFFFNDTATTEIYTLSLHDALPI